MQLKYIEKHFVVTGTYDEMVVRGGKDIPKAAGFRFSPEGEEPLPRFAVWWTDDPVAAAKLVKYATKKALAALHKIDDKRTRILAASAKRRVTAVKKEKTRRAQRRVDFEDVGKAFDELCREEGIPIREDFELDAEYEEARLVATVKGEK